MLVNENCGNGSQMTRRQLLRVLALALVAMPVAAEAQQAPRVYRVALVYKAITRPGNSSASLAVSGRLLSASRLWKNRSPRLAE
jgi:hypothetical protein